MKLVERFEELAHSLLDKVKGGVDQLSPYQAGILSGVMTDKLVVLRQAGGRGGGGRERDEIAQLTATPQGRQALANMAEAFAEVMRTAAAAERSLAALPAADVQLSPGEVREV